MGREDDNNAEQIRLESLYILLVKANNVKLQIDVLANRIEGAIR